MLSKKKIIIIIALLIVCLIGIIFMRNNKKENDIIKSKKEQIIISSNAISMMYETEVGSGEYQASTDTSWPSSGYIFNERLSGCENGGTLSWNNETKRVIMQTNKSDKCYVYFDKYGIPIISEVTTGNITTGSITLNVTASGGTNSVKTYYYSSNNGSSYVSSTSSSYTFTGLTKGTTYNFKVYVVDAEGYPSSTESISATTDNVLFADYIKSLYTSQGSNEIYYHTSSLANSAADNSYRYAGANPNNYVCFGSESTTCPSDNLYRIIGVFDSEVKLIKSTIYGSYKWNSQWNNTWDSNAKPDIKDTLNTTYYNSLSVAWQNKIALHTWKVGGLENNDLYTAKQYYDIEVGNNSNSITDSMKIGLMYVSDYGYSVSNNCWTTSLYNYSNLTSINWLYLGVEEWTISHLPLTSSTFAFSVYSNGCLSYRNVALSEAIRPSFYLTSSTTYVRGSGTSANPFIIN